jgi:hypothetical protein
VTLESRSVPELLALGDVKTSIFLLWLFADMLNVRVVDPVQSLTAKCIKSEADHAMDNLLHFLGDILGNAISGNPSKSKLMRWVERIFIALVVMLIALVLYRIYST